MSHAVKMGVGRIVKPAHLRPADQGREMSLEEFEHASGQEGYRYELIDGRVEVSPEPEIPHDTLIVWIADHLCEYRRDHRDVVGRISQHARVHLPERRPATCPEPDLTVYRIPFLNTVCTQSWRSISPFLVVETISPDNAKKDLERNVELYLEVPTIREYWIVDGRPVADKPKLIVYRRRGQNWQKQIVVPFGETYETKMLPGFKLVVDPHVES